jgi:hypothetical protein
MIHQNERKVFSLSIEGSRLWTREKAKEIRIKVEQALDQVPNGGIMEIEASGVEVFDYSFAAELFGKLILKLAAEFPDRLLAVSGISDYTRENLNAALGGVGAILLEIKPGDKWGLLGKTIPSDTHTLEALENAGKPVGAPELARILGINVTACNERLTKLLQFGLVRRVEAGNGRLQYLYSFIFK